MHEREFLCLRCGYLFPPRKADTIGVRQCPKCNNKDVIQLPEIEEMAELARHLMETTPLGVVPVTDTARAIMLKKGLLRYRALQTLNLESLLYKIAKENKTLPQAIKEVFPDRPSPRSDISVEV